MTTKFKTFQEFYDQCNELYDMYEPHFLLQGCDIITNFEGNEIDNGCWYCIVKIRENVHTVLAYDHTDGTDKPFVVYCDWSKQPGIAMEYSAYTECKEFDNLECAFYYLKEEPSVFLQRPYDGVLVMEKGKCGAMDAAYNIWGGEGLLDSIKLIEERKEEFKGKTMQIIQKSDWDMTILYQRTI